jgi:hypothetical protein
VRAGWLAARQAQRDGAPAQLSVNNDHQRGEPAMSERLGARHWRERADVRRR